jgi:hypothetical protein
MREISVLGVDIAKRVFQGYFRDGCKKVSQDLSSLKTIHCNIVLSWKFLPKAVVG